MKKKLTKKEKLEIILQTKINLPSNESVTLEYLVKKIGVKNKVEYFNIREVKVPKGKALISSTRIADVSHDFGLIFENGIELRHVEKLLYNSIDANIIKKIERFNYNF